VNNLLCKTILTSQINIRKRVMYATAKSYGFTHPRVVAHSQKVDALINRYQRNYSNFGWNIPSILLVAKTLTIN